MAADNLMKDGLDKAAVQRISQAFTQLVAEFDGEDFQQQVMLKLTDLELKQRVGHIIDVLCDTLPGDFAEQADYFHKLPEVWDFGDPDDALRGFAAWPIIDYVSVKASDQPEVALPVLARLTHLFSAEFAIRSFLINHFDVTYSVLETWIDNPSEHVRRLVSEGIRPRLPWGQQLKALITDPSPIFPLLAKLRHDSSQYVKRSVANNLNDISKDHPELMLDILEDWQRQDQTHLNQTSQNPTNQNPTNQNQTGSDWIIGHATRSLEKQGNQRCLKLLGYNPNANIEVLAFNVNESVDMGQKLDFDCHIKNLSAAGKFVIDFCIYFQKANGDLAPKVFKLKKTQLKQGEKLQLIKHHSFKKITTRVYYPGLHQLAILVNGKEVARQDFELKG